MSRRYAAAVDAHRWWILAAALAVAIGCGMIAARLPLRPDLSTLLPPGQESVRHLRALQARAQAFGTIYVVVESESPELRERAANELARRLRALDGDLVANVIFDEGVARRYFWDNRFLLVSLEDLTEARDALQEKIQRAKLEANPLYIDLEDSPADEDGDSRIEDLRKRLDEAEAKANAPPGFISDSGRMQLVIVRTPFGSSQFGKSERLISAIEGIFDDLRAELGEGVQLGSTGNVVMSLDENRSVMRGLVTAAVITILICALALLLYYRAVLPVMASLWSLAVGTLATFAFAQLAIGHLNLVTAFLAAIVVGNGVNAGLILLARYFEEVRAGREGNDALARALAGAVRGTFAASLAAGAAYCSLIVTDFRGFRHFGVIGGVGMVLCWITAFTVLPAGLAVLWRAGRIRASRAPSIGRLVARLLPKNLDRVAVVGGVLTAIALAATVAYALSDPLQQDWSDLRPKGSETTAARHWDERMREEFGDRIGRGLTQQFMIGLERREDVTRVVQMLRAHDDGKPADQRLLHNITSIDDLVPPDQQAKLAVLDEIRRLIDDDLAAELDEDDRELLARVRPPKQIALLRDDTVPDDIAWPFTEADGTRGRLIVATGSLRFKTWNIRHRMEFSSEFRKLELPEGTIVGGQSFIFADMVKAMSRDAPLATGAALIGAILVVGLVVGLRRHGAVTLMCGLAGIFGMIALVSLVGLKINVIDFIALPITIGLGIDYAVNIVARERQDWQRGPHAVIATTGGAVLLCSFTTIVGYGSLLLSDSGGIRSFGLAAILGEFACVIAAIAFAPALLAFIRRRDERAAAAAAAAADSPR